MQNYIKNNNFLTKILSHRVGRKIVHKVTNKRFVLKKVNTFNLLLDLKDGSGVSKYILKHGNYDPFASNFVKQFIKSHSTVIDIGANIGYWSNLLASFDSTIKVLAFEPEPFNFKLLQENTKLNANCNRVQLISKALSNSKGNFNLYLSDNNAGDHRLYDSLENRNFVSVETVVGDDEINVNNISFIKIDVQGFEYKVLSGMKNLISKNNDLSILSEFWPYGMKMAGDDPVEFLKMMFSFNFKFYALLEDSQEIFKINIEKALELTPDKKHIDILFSKREIKL
ncbi:FkbM family methyltransferase [Spirobacillus cienkowskii]|uniref:FkbM family methyltransferase n=1 Tax=Spirobacillus cienkowskii TaxID=495820 RepID=UPI0030CDB484